MNDLEARVKGEMRSLVEKSENQASDMRGLILALEQQIRTLRHQTDQVKSTCMQHADDCKAVASNDLQEHFERLSNDLTVQSEESRQSDLEAVEKSKAHAQILHETMTSSHQELSTLVSGQYVELQLGIEKAEASARESAAVSTADALQQVTDHLQDMVTRASVSLKERIEALSQELSENPDLSSHGKYLEAQGQELQGGFYSLLARDAVDAQLRVMVDRAAKRIQAQSDDLAKRIMSRQEQIEYVEQRLQSLPSAEVIDCAM